VGDFSVIGSLSSSDCKSNKNNHCLKINFWERGDYSVIFFFFLASFTVDRAHWKWTARSAIEINLRE